MCRRDRAMPHSHLHTNGGLRLAIHIDAQASPLIAGGSPPNRSGSDNPALLAQQFDLSITVKAVQLFADSAERLQRCDVHIRIGHIAFSPLQYQFVTGFISPSQADADC